jgi:hypothetical protein
MGITKSYHPPVQSYGNILELMDWWKPHDSIILITGHAVD